MEEEIQRPVGAETAELGDRADGCVGFREQREGPLQADVQDFVEDGMTGRLAEAHVEKSARAVEARGKRGGGESVAGFAADHLHRFEDAMLVPSRPLVDFRRMASSGPNDTAVDSPPSILAAT